MFLLQTRFEFKWIEVSYSSILAEELVNYIKLRVPNEQETSKRIKSVCTKEAK
jgi:hypothetical protein